MNRLGMVLLALLTLIHGHAQDPIIKVETPNVVVDVIVTDWKGHHVSGLTTFRKRSSH